MGVKAIVEKGFCCEEETQLTVQKTSLFSEGDGFTVYDAQAQIVFRVDTYGSDSRHLDQLVLMNASGNCILTVHRKQRPSLHQRWEGFLGDRTEGQKPIFSVRRSFIIGRSSVTAEVYSEPAEEYQIEGSYPHRSCTFYCTSAAADCLRQPVAKIKRKVAPSANVMLDKDVFCLCLGPGFDGAFAMGLVLVLDQLNGDDNDRDDDYDGTDGADRAPDGDAFESKAENGLSHCLCREPIP
ncbi:hypothetical protein ACLOJK_020206 [Asimina triloba]